MASPRPTTPSSVPRRSSRRHSHRSSGIHLLSQSPKVHYPVNADTLPLDSPQNTEKFERLSDCLEELESYMTKLQLIHESMSCGFNEAFSSFLYGLSMTMWCVDFPGCPSKKVWEELHAKKQANQRLQELNEKLQQAQVLNEQLKTQLSDSKSSILTQTVVDDSENDSFVSNPQSGVRGTRIPQLKSTNRQLERNSKYGPNLNQAPRYMRGLFDASNMRQSSVKSREDRGRVSKGSRPRFR